MALHKSIPAAILEWFDAMSNLWGTGRWREFDIVWTLNQRHISIFMNSLDCNYPFCDQLKTHRR